MGGTPRRRMPCASRAAWVSRASRATAIALISSLASPITLAPGARAAGNPSARESAGAIEGVALDHKGKPIAGALVAAVPENSGSSEEDTRSPAMARSGRDGRFRLAPLPPGPYGVTATRTGLAAAFKGSLIVGPAKTLRGVKLTFGASGGTLRGRVRDNHGRPVPRAQVRALRYSDFLGDVFYANADSSGAYEITLPQANYLMLVVAEGSDSESRSTNANKDQSLDFTLYPPSKPGPAPEAVVGWIRSNAIPLRTVEAGHGFSDMEPLRAVCGDARVVSLGEATHGTREFFQLKHRTLEFLAERMGFTVFGIEASMPEGFDVNEYVLTGRGDPAKALSGLYFWTWNTEEVLDLILWMRSWNADPTHQRKLKFYGFDMQSSPRAVRRVIGYLRRVDPGEAVRIAAVLEPIADPYRASRFSRLPADRRAEIDSTLTLLLRGFDGRKAAYVRRSNASEWAIVRQHARILGQWAGLAGPEGSATRDRAMAENIRWILEHEGPDSKIVVWAHNGHVSAAAPGVSANGMGSYLRAALGDNMVIFGFAFNRGSFQAIERSGRAFRGLRRFEVGSAPEGSLDQTLEHAGLRTAAIDLRKIPQAGPVADWFSSRHATRSIGAVFSDSLAGRYFASIVAPQHFDAILFVDSTSAARANQHGRRPRVVPRGVPTNLDFEDGVLGGSLPGWTASSGLAEERYRVEQTKEAPHSGARCAKVRSVGGRSYGEWYGNLSQSIEAVSYREKRVGLRAWVRVRPEADGGRAHLWLRVSGPGMESFFDGMEDRPITVDEWREYRLEGDVPKDAVSIDYGLSFVGEGAAWLDGVSFGPIGP